MRVRISNDGTESVVVRRNISDMDWLELRDAKGNAIKSQVDTVESYVGIEEVAKDFVLLDPGEVFETTWTLKNRARR